RGGRARDRDPGGVVRQRAAHRRHQEPPRAARGRLVHAAGPRGVGPGLQQRRLRRRPRAHLPDRPQARPARPRAGVTMPRAGVTLAVVALLLAVPVTAAAQLQKIKVTLPAAAVTFASLYHAKTAGYFAQEGLDVEIVT